MDRTALQGIAAHRLAKEHRLLCQWATGVGKSQVVLQFLQANPEMNCLILVPEQNNIENWEAEFDKFGVSREKVSIICYASFHKYRNTTWDLLVFDEAPHTDTEKRRAICKSVRGEYILALGAVIDEEETYALESSYGKFEKSYVSLRKAIEWGILPSPTINVCHIRLDNEHQNCWYKGKQYTQKGLYDQLQKKVEAAVLLYNKKADERNRRLMLSAGNERKRFLGKIKEDVARAITAALESQNKRFICFCSSIKQAEDLCKEHAFTSKTPTGLKLLERFNNHDINSLFVVGKLIEGQNLNDIEHGVIIQLGGTSRITVQSIGRIMRSKNPVIWIPVFDGTKDESFLYTLTSNIPNDYIKHYNY